MSVWDELFREERHRWTEPDDSVVRFAESLRQERCQRVLDLGCGAGRHVVFLAQAGFLVVGSDIAARGLYWTKRAAQEESLSNYLLVRHDLNDAIKKAFEKAGIEIAFPQRDIHVRSVEAPFPIRDNRDDMSST